MKPKFNRRQLVSNPPHRQNVRVIRSKHKASLFKPYGMQGKTTKVLPTP